MEQKQLDEEEDYFGEEFVEEEAPQKGAKEEVKEKPKKAKKAAKKSKPAKTAKVDVNTEEDQETSKDPKEEKVDKEDIEIKPATEPIDSPTETPIDPWADDEDDDAGLFKEASTWKAITGIAVILLILSVFTQGFQFSGPEESNTLSIEEAEGKALAFVNENLLRPPFSAEVEGTENMDSLYKVTLAVAGESVDSYITKDGVLFFPQGFDTSQPLPGSDTPEEVPEIIPIEEEIKLIEEETPEPIVEEIPPTEEAETIPPVEVPELPVEELEEAAIVVPEEELAVEPEAPAEEEPTEEDVEEPVEEIVEEPTGTKPLVLNAKKWLFTPSDVEVNTGDKVVLTIVPSGLDFTFAIPALDIEEEITARTIVEFTAAEAGTFEFVCSSCEEWRGMSGTLLVK